MIRRTIYRTLCVTVLLVFPFAACSPVNDPTAPNQETLRKLLLDGANRHQVEKTLGAGYRLYERGGSGWDSLRSTSSQKVQEATNRFPRVMFYTTMWQRTFVFLDKDDVMRDFAITDQ
jgi:hypothetical protein